jgi:hypothetical protein
MQGLMKYDAADGVPESLTNTVDPRVCWEFTVMQLVEVLHYKPEGRGLDFRWGH